MKMLGTKFHYITENGTLGLMSQYKQILFGEVAGGYYLDK